MSGTTISTLASPWYNLFKSEYVKYRDLLSSGTDFRDKYLKQYNQRESTTEFITRRSISYVPSVALAGITKFKNAIFQRMADITRTGGDVTYQEAIGGDWKGVDNSGRSMNQFIGQQIILELLAMGRVGVMVDREQLPEIASVADTRMSRPYLYTYKAEDILNITFDGITIDKILLRSSNRVLDDVLGLYTKDKVEHIFMERFNGFVLYRVYGESLDNLIDEVIINIPEIPFVLFEIERSLLRDIVDYQIALLNIESGDINYCWKANFPFFTEQQEMTAANFSKLQLSMDSDGNEVGTASNEGQTISGGPLNGRIYGTNTERPGFIHPSSEPLRASMDKQKDMRDTIEYLIGMNVQSLASSSAQSKEAGASLKEEGLSAIGLELERGERRIAQIWSFYVGSDDVATIDYPNNYSLRTDADRRAEAKQIIEDAKKIPSKTFQKESAKRAARLLMTQGVGKIDWGKIDSEINQAVLVFADPVDIQKDKELGIVSTETASLQRGYPEGEAEKAKADKLEAIKQAAMAQSSNTNNLEARIGGGEDAKTEKELSQEPLLSDSGKKTRGDEK